MLTRCSPYKLRFEKPSGWMTTFQPHLLVRRGIRKILYFLESFGGFLKYGYPQKRWLIHAYTVYNTENESSIKSIYIDIYIYNIYNGKYHL